MSELAEGIGGTVIEQIAMVVLLFWPIALFVSCVVLLLYGIGGTLRNLFDKRTLRCVTRTPFRFRLRTMLLAAALLQVVFATVAWQQQESGAYGLMLVWLAGLSFVAWVVLVALEEFFEPTASRRWKRVVRGDRVHALDATYPTRGNRKTNVEPPPRVASLGQRTRGD